MAKIWKSARKQHKSMHDKYRDGMDSFRQSIKSNQWAVKTDTLNKTIIERNWLARGGKVKDLYRLGLTKAVTLIPELNRII